MSSPWPENRCKKDAEKANKYSPLRYELKQQFKEYKLEQFNIIIDVLCGGRKDDQAGGKERQSSAGKNAESCNFIDLEHCAFFQSTFVVA